ncbi:MULTISPECIES: sporulation histidine kinase inhibitor Sda [Sporosarcina]|nr:MULTISPECIES: sporulation histidine kinase inhibitor Sda [Sporosarcina]PIC56415.1 sporulation histidine kinase inhibitor Sda [Sporosarcina sp. P10]PIC59712.1 sporulation histidine kinase inhibitor Sda [Sporosarcina sp. P12(2017)]PIC76132.1 sporulation histidine kinase inhibitor Sda [Sporosarcina sp. P19]
MLKLSNAALLEAYESTEEIRVEPEFIQLLEEEIKRRGL